MVYSRKVRFNGDLPAIQTIVDGVRERTGIQACYLADKWLLINPAASSDVLSLYPEGENTLLLLNDESETALLKATLQTLFDLGGYSVTGDDLVE